MGQGMARRRKRLSAIHWWLVFVTVACAAWYARSWALAAADITLWGVYQLFLVRTTCGVETVSRPGRPCENTAHGRLRACPQQQSHKRVKRDTLFRLVVGRENPFVALRRTWARPEGSPPAIGMVGREDSDSVVIVGASFRDTVTFLMTVIAAIGTIAGVWLSYLQLVKG